MASEVRFNQIYNYWWEDLKWSGVFDINWIYIKDIHHADVQSITYNNTPIANLKDGSAIDFQAGRSLLEIFRNTKSTTDIFESDRKSTRLNSSHIPLSRMPSSA